MAIIDKVCVVFAQSRACLVIPERVRNNCTSELGLFLFWLKHYVKHFWMYAITVGVSPLTFPLCAYNFHRRVLVEWLMSLNSLIS